MSLQIPPTTLASARALPAWLTNPELQGKLRFKYLSYCPPPVRLDPSSYDLVEDEVFCEADERLPLLLVIQYGIFPIQGCFPQCSKNYDLFDGLEDQWVALRRRGYLSDRESPFIQYLFVDKDLIKAIRQEGLETDWTWLDGLPRLQSYPHHNINMEGNKQH
jgi:hypothetical protein